MIKAILFDFDGVLTTDSTGSLTTCRHLAQSLGLATSVVQAAFQPHNKQLTLGRCTHANVWPEVCRSLARQVDPTLLLAAFDSTPMSAPMMALARALEPKYALGIVTDNKRDRMDRLRALHRLDDLFDPIVVSAELGSGKESAAIFETALRHLGLRAHECVFIDNSPGNLIAPESIGMTSLWHDDQRNDVDALVEQLRVQCGVSPA